MANKKRVMIVDDDKDIITSLKVLLESNGYKVYSYTDGHECIKALRNGKKPTLIILDIMMPVMSGWEIQRRLQENPDWDSIPIVFLSARSTDTAKEMYEQYGIDYILKPFDIKEFLSKINAFLLNKKRVFC